MCAVLWAVLVPVYHADVFLRVLQHETREERSVFRPRRLLVLPDHDHPAAGRLQRRPAVAHRHAAPRPFPRLRIIILFFKNVLQKFADTKLQIKFTILISTCSHDLSSNWFDFAGNPVLLVATRALRPAVFLQLSDPGFPVPILLDGDAHVC